MRMLVSRTVSVLLLSSCGLLPAGAQDIFVFDLAKRNDGYALTNGKNATNRPGYDNQPFFTADGTAFLFTSVRGELPDVHEYRIDTGEIRQVTDTPGIPEYSPVPDEDGTRFTVVRENTVPDQTVWRVDRATGEAEWALISREPIGYYAFNGRGEALVWVRYAFAIHFVRPSAGETFFVTGHAAPSAPKRIPGGEAFSFVHRQVNGETWIKRFDPETRSIAPLAALPGAQIDYGWTPDGSVLAGSGSKLLSFQPGEASEWTEVAELEPFGLRDITRLAVSPDGSKIAIVAADP